MIPSNITQEHILKAIEQVDKYGVPDDRVSHDYLLEVDGNKYPPKYIISVANRFANGKDLEPHAFSGGDEANNFLQSRGFEVTRTDAEEIVEKHEFAGPLKTYLERRFSIKISKNRGHLFLPSGTIIHVRGSKILAGNRGFYHLQERDYDDTITHSNRYFVAVFGDVNNTFIFSPQKLKEIFEKYASVTREKNESKMYFDIYKKDDTHYLKLRGLDNNEFNIEDQMNKLDTIEDLKGKDTLSTIDYDMPQYFLVQVNQSGSEEILNHNGYEHRNWKETPRDIYHGMVRTGDLLLIYFARQAIKYKMQLKKIYKVRSVSEHNSRFELTEERDLQGLSLDQIREAINAGKLKKQVFEKVSQQGFNILKIEKEDYDSVISLETELLQGTVQKEPNIWLIREGDEGQGELVALEKNVIGIGYDGLPGLDSIKDLNDYKRHYADTHPNDSINRIGKVVPQIWNFMYKIKKGDLVLLPLKTQGSKFVAVGEVMGDYQYEDLNSEIKQFRPIKWYKKDVPRDEFDPEIASLLNSQGTVYYIGGVDAVNKILAMMKRLAFTDIALRDETFGQSQDFARHIFVTGYDDANLKISKERQILGWAKNSTFLSPDSIVFVFNRTNLTIDCCFKVISKSDNTSEFIWADEIRANNVLYPNRWSADLIQDKLSIHLTEINNIPPFNTEPFQGLLRANFPMPLDSPQNKHKYEEFRKFLLHSVKGSLNAEIDRPTKLVEEFLWEDQPLQMPSVEQLNVAIGKIKDKLLIDDNTIRNIVSSLVAGKHILLAGPIGTGKTHLARMISAYVWSDFDGGYFSELFTATSIWTTQEVIGGIYPKMDDKSVVYETQKGCVSDTVSRNWQYGARGFKRKKYTDTNGKSYRGVWLVIDEFNRANIDSAFGDMITAFEHGSLKIPTDKKGIYFEELAIPKDFRIIGTLNTFDKHFLFKLSDALKRRFAYIEILPPNTQNAEEEKYYVLKRSLEELDHIPILGSKISLIQDKHEIDRNNTDANILRILDSAYEMFRFIRYTKNLGTAVLISIFRFVLVDSLLNDNLDNSLDNAFKSNIVPQLEGRSRWSLEVIRSFCCEQISEFLKKRDVGLTDFGKYQHEFTKLISYFGKAGIENRLARYKGKEMLDTEWDEYNPWIGKQKPRLPLFRKSLNDLIEETEII